MSTQRTNNDHPDTSDAPAKGGGRMKVLLMASMAMIAEAALIAAAFMFMGGPGEVAAEGVVHEVPIEGRRISEVMLVDEQLTNDRLGSVYVYPVEIYVHVPEDEQVWFDDQVSQFQNEIRAEVTALWRSADPAALQDPRMEVVTARVTSLLRERFEGEADPEHPRIRKVVIVSGTGFRVRG
jgi:hypothetical protein